jgi:hypothetical protein
MYNPSRGEPEGSPLPLLIKPDTHFQPIIFNIYLTQNHLFVGVLNKKENRFF